MNSCTGLFAGISKLLCCAAVFAPLVFCPAQACAALVGQLQAANGKNYAGEIRLRDGGFQVVDREAATNVVGFDQLVRLQCEAVPDDVWRRKTQTGHGLAGTYFDNQDFTGQSLQRVDPEINFTWGAAEPASGVGVNEYSVRWIGQLEAPADGRFTFFLHSDDSRRLWVGDKLLIDQWRDQPPAETHGEMDLVAGRRYPLKLEYAQRAGDAVVKLSWSGPNLPQQIIPSNQLWPPGAFAAPTVPGHGLSAAYFRGTDLGGQPRLRTDVRIDFDWGGSAPIDGLGADGFSVRWLGSLKALTTEPHAFHVQSDDGMRVWLDEVLIIDAWGNGPRNVKSKMLRMDKTKEYRLRVEYLDVEGEAKAKLSWLSASMPECVVPTEQLTPARPEETRKLLADAGTGLANGIVLSQGTVIARDVHSADETTVRFSASSKDPGMSTVNVARIILQTLSRSALEKIERGRAGLLLHNNDFIDGNFQSMDGQRVKVSSVLFGLRSFDRSRVRAILLRPVEPVPVHFEVKARDGSLYRADRFVVQAGGISFGDPCLAGLKVAGGDLVEVTRTP